MNRVLKTFLLWLLIAALPLQGMAAVVQASCGPRHHAMSSTGTGMADHHHENGATSHTHSDMVGQKADVSADGGSNLESSSKSFHKLASCSACASCCFGAAAPPPTLSIAPVLSSVEAAVLPPVVSFTGFIPASLERPPRHLSA